MKNYKNIVPIVLIILFALGIYMKYDTNMSIIREYEGYLTSAREYREKEIWVDAESYYLSAMDLKPNVELSVEIGEFYKEINTQTARKWAEDVIESYPDESLGYEFLLQLYMELGRYGDFLTVYDEVGNRGLVTDKIYAMAEELSAKYYFSGNYDEVGLFAEGYCPVMIDGFWKYIYLYGQEATGLSYVSAGSYCGGISPIKVNEEEYVLIDYEGNKKQVIQNVPKIEKIGSTYGNICSIYDGSTWGIYDFDGELLYGGYSDVSAFGNGVIAVEENGKWSLLDVEGKLLIDENYDSIIADEKEITYRNERLFVEKKGKFYLIDITGKRIVEESFSDAKIFNGEGYAAVKVGTKWGFINKDGEMIIEPMYEDARSFSNGYAAVKMNGKWGFINAQNELKIEYQFTDAKDFNEGGCVLVKGDKWQMLHMYLFNF